MRFMTDIMFHFKKKCVICCILKFNEMKPKLLFFTSLLFCFTLFLQAQTDGTLTFTFTHSRPTSNSGDGDLLAVWVEHSNGTFIKAKMCYDGSERDHLPVFAVKAGGTASNSSHSNIDMSDATSGATLKSGSGNPRAWSTYTIVWDGKDLSGTVVPDGDYKMFIESAWDASLSHPQHNYIADFTFTKGSVAQSLTPTSVSPINTVSLVWTTAALGIDDNTLEKNNILVYPNPSNGIIHINFKNTLVNKIQVFDVLGRTVYQELVDTSSFESAKTLDLSNNTKGIYILKFYSDKGTSSHKVLIGN